MSLKFFADRGRPQIFAGYYDAPDLRGFTKCDTTAHGVPGVVGFVYTTWERKFG